VVWVLVAVTVTLALSLLSWFLLERPLMRWRKRLEAKRTAEPATTPGLAEPSTGTRDPGHGYVADGGSHPTATSWECRQFGRHHHAQPARP
jgi:hypothetical protein